MDTERLAFFRHAFGGAWMTQALAVAAELGIADQLAGGPRTIAQLASTTNTHPPSLYRVLRALASVGVYAEIEPQQFALTPLAEFLRNDTPGSQRAMSIMMGGEFHTAWGELLHATRTGEPGFGKWLDLMMLLVAGWERTEAEFRRLFEATGLELKHILPTTTEVCILKATHVR